jgi:hypothetical protein
MTPGPSRVRTHMPLPTLATSKPRHSEAPKATRQSRAALDRFASLAMTTSNVPLLFSKNK